MAVGELTEGPKQFSLTVFRDPALLGKGVRYRAAVPPGDQELKEDISQFLDYLRPLKPRSHIHS